MLAGATAGQGICRIGSGSYRAILLDSVEVAEPELVEAIATIAEAGIPVLALGALPHRAPGLRDAKARDQRVRAATKRLSSHVLRVPQLDQLEAILEKNVRSTLVEPLPESRLAVSIERRRSGAGDTLLLFNESWSPRTTQLRFTRGGGALTLWDPRSGLQERLRDHVETGDVVTVELEAVESLILTLGAPVKAQNGRR